MLVIFLMYLNVILGFSKGLHYTGPYVLWGPEKIKNGKLPALNVLNSDQMASIYNNLESLYIFVVNSTQHRSICKVRDVIGGENFAYLAQPNISDPTQNGVKVRKILLNANNMKDMEELRAKFHFITNSAQANNVMGVLASSVPDKRYKRESDPALSTKIENKTEELLEQNFIYKADGKVILYTTTAPILLIGKQNPPKNITQKYLKTHGLVTVDEREQFWRLSVTFSVEGDKTTLRFKFPVANGYWSLNQVEVVDEDFNGNLTVLGEVPGAPIGFSHKCSRELIFQNNFTTLKLANIQVQPLLQGANSFSEPFDCIGFTTIPIWSGIFVSLFLLIGTCIGITTIMDIKSPSKFESGRSKQLTFTVQE